MTMAQAILKNNTDTAALFAACEKVAVSTDQDWDHEETLYQFADESVIVLNGPHAAAYESESHASRQG